MDQAASSGRAVGGGPVAVPVLLSDEPVAHAVGPGLITGISGDEVEQGTAPAALADRVVVELPVSGGHGEVLVEAGQCQVFRIGVGQIEAAQEPGGDPTHGPALEPGDAILHHEPEGLLGVKLAVGRLAGAGPVVVEAVGKLVLGVVDPAQETRHRPRRRQISRCQAGEAASGSVGDTLIVALGAVLAAVVGESA